MSNLTALGLPECLGCPKKWKETSKFDQIVWLLTMKMTSNQKMSGEKSYILAKDLNTERKFEIKAKKNLA